MKRTIFGIFMVVVILLGKVTSVRAESIVEDVENEENISIFKELDLLKIEEVNLDELMNYVSENEEHKMVIETISFVAKNKVLSSLYRNDILFKDNSFALTTNYNLKKLMGFESMYLMKGYEIVESVAYAPVGVYDGNIVFCEVTIKDFVIEDSDFTECFSTMNMRYVQIQTELEVTAID